MCSFQSVTCDVDILDQRPKDPQYVLKKYKCVGGTAHEGHTRKKSIQVPVCFCLSVSLCVCVSCYFSVSVCTYVCVCLAVAVFDSVCL